MVSCRNNIDDKMADEVLSNDPNPFAISYDQRSSPFKRNAFPSPERRGARGEVSHNVSGGRWDVGGFKRQKVDI